MRVRKRSCDQGGQASVELLALLPVLVACVALGWQLILAGQAWWLAGAAAHNAARALAVGGDARDAARSALGSRFAGRADVETSGDGSVRVRVPLPAPLGIELGSVESRSRMKPQR